jgi:hypothetical protein
MSQKGVDHRHASCRSRIEVMTGAGQQQRPRLSSNSKFA